MLERKAPPTFPLVIEMRERAYWVTHWVEDSVDCLLHGKVPVVQVLRFLLLTGQSVKRLLETHTRDCLMGGNAEQSSEVACLALPCSVA